MHNGKMVLSKYVWQIIDECYLGITKTFFLNIDFKLAHDKRPSEIVSDGLGYWRRLISTLPTAFRVFRRNRHCS